MRKKYFLLVFLVVFALGFFVVETSALASGKVVVYSSNQQSQNDLMAADFEKATGIKCEMVRAGSGVLIKRIKAEAARPLGDVVLGLSKDILLNNIDLWEPYKIKDFDVYPAEYKDPNGMWIGKILHVMAFMYNKNLVSDAQAPKGWNDFLDPKWKDRVAFCNPNNSGSSYTQLAIMLQLWGSGEAAWKKAETFLRNAKVTQQSSLVYTGVANGEFPAGITMEYAVFRYKKGGAPIEIVYPAEGTVAYTEGMAIIKDTKNRKEARAFLDWATGVEARKKIVSEFMRRPARPDIDFTDLMPGMLPLSKVKLMDFKEDYWTEQRPAALARVKDILLKVR